MPGTTPGIFIFIVFGTTASSRQKLRDLLIPERLRGSSRRCCCFRRRRPSSSSTRGPLTSCDGGIHVEHSLTITSDSRMRGSHIIDDDFPDPRDIRMSDLPKRSDSARSVHITHLKPLPLTPQTPSSRFRSLSSPASDPAVGRSWGTTTTTIRELPIEEKSSAEDTLTRTNSDDSLRVPDDYHTLGPEHSDDSGPILPIQRQEVRFSRENLYINRNRSRSLADDWQSKNFSRPGR